MRERSLFSVHNWVPIYNTSVLIWIFMVACFIDVSFFTDIYCKQNICCVFHISTSLFLFYDEIFTYIKTSFRNNLHDVKCYVSYEKQIVFFTFLFYYRSICICAKIYDPFILITKEERLNHKNIWSFWRVEITLYKSLHP